MAAGTKVMKCTCANTQQDAIHGVGNRVWNKAGKEGSSTFGYRCTSCNNKVMQSEKATKKEAAKDAAADKKKGK